MYCLLLVRRWQLPVWIAGIWLISMTFYVLRAPKQADDAFGAELHEFEITESRLDKEQIKPAPSVMAVEKSFEKWKLGSDYFDDIIININSNNNRNRIRGMEKETSDFIPLNSAKVTTLNNVCIRRNLINMSSIFNRRCVEHKYSLVMYSSGLNIERSLFGFNISYKTIPSPDGYNFVNDTAFFHGFDKFFWPDNFYHFTKQFYFPLHYLINKTNSLKAKTGNIVFFAKPYYPCINAPFTDYFFPHLHIKDGTSYAYYPGFHSGGVCFKNAVFSNELHLQHAEDSIKYIRLQFGAKLESCTVRNKIILLGRWKNRRIVNSLNLINIALQNGVRNVSIVYMEDLTMKEQMQTMFCADVMIGVQGAGLQWAYFMRPLSVVIEVAWPNYGWNFFYSKLYTKEGVIKKINFMALETNDIANKTECLQRHLMTHRPKIKLTQEQEKMTVEELFKVLKLTYPGKTCDVYIDEKQFLETIKRAVDMIGH